MKNSVNMEFVAIQEGVFIMGSPEDEVGRFDDELQHEEKVSAFAIQTTPVTRKQYFDVLGEDPSYFKHDWNCPVELVSWYDANRFISALNAKEGDTYRLPSEAEWEYACRAGATGPRYFNIDNVDQYAWFYGNSYYQTNPVGQKLPNQYGLFDMLGNVWEWCEDRYLEDFTQSDSAELRVLRGGSWFNRPAYLRSANRYWFAPGSRYDYTGLRLAKTI